VVPAGSSGGLGQLSHGGSPVRRELGADQDNAVPVSAAREQHSPLVVSSSPWGLM
jgi:hypothetical protein